jgi:hypothetical protein
MKLQRKALVRNLVIAMVVADGVGVYLLQDRLSNPLQDSNAAFEAEALALSASEAAKPQFQPPHEAVPQTVAPQQAEASRELPKPAFGMDTAAPVQTAKVSVPAVAAPVVTAKTAVAAKAPVTAKVAAAAAVPTAKAAPTVTAKRTIAVPRVASLNTYKSPVTVSVKPSSNSAKAKAPAHRAVFSKASGTKAYGFTKAFGVSRATPSVAVTTASGSLQNVGPVITADFAPDSTQPVEAAPEVTATLAVATPADTVTTDQAPARDMSAPAPTETAPSELPPSGE